MKKILSLLMLLTVAIPSLMATDFKKVTDVSELEAGANYLIVYGTTKAMGNYSTYRTAVGISVKDDIISVSGNTVAVLELGGSEDAWTFKDISTDTQGFLQCDGSKNSIKNVDTADENCKFKLSKQTDGTFTIVSAVSDRTTYNYLQYNTSSPRFACYSNTQKNPFLYKEYVSAAVADPTISLKAGTYYETQTLTITAPVGATLEGTLNGKDISGTSFTTTLELVAGETKKYELRVAAKKDDVSSDIVEAVYVFDGQAVDATVTGNIVIADQKESALWDKQVTEGTLTDIFGHVFNLSKSGSGNNMTINKNSNTFRMYKNTTVTFDAGDFKMTKIEVTKYSSSDAQTKAMEIEGWTVSEDLTTFTCNDAKGSQTITFKPTATNAWSNIKITYKGKVHYDKVVDGAALIGMEKGKFYQVNVVLQGVKANDGVLYARTSAKSAALSEPAEDHKGFDSYEDGYKLESYQQRDWVVINGLGVDYEGMEVATGFIASYDGEKLTPVAAPAAVSAADVTNINTFGVANVFYGNYENMDETLTSQTNGYKPFFVKAKVNEVAYYVGEVKEVNGGLELWGSGACGNLNKKGLKIDANGIDIAASTEYQQIEGVLVADAAANGGVKLVALSAPTTPTGVAALKADGKATIYGTEGAVVVNGADGKVMIFDAMGRMVKNVSAEGTATVAMPAGYYIVRTAGTAAKVMVK